MYLMSRIVSGYMCKVDWEYELGEACGGTKIYPDLEDIKENCKCVKGCGIVKVKIELDHVVEPGVPFSERTTYRTFKGKMWKKDRSKGDDFDNI